MRKVATDARVVFNVGGAHDIAALGSKYLIDVGNRNDELIVSPEPVVTASAECHIMATSSGGIRDRIQILNGGGDRGSKNMNPKG